MIFGRGNFTQLWIRLTSDEPLGLLDSDYIEDFFGADGFLTLHHVDTATDYQIVMTPVPGDTPGVENDIFQGVYSPLSSLPDGEYLLRGRVRDPYGNYTILDSVQSPIGNERVLRLDFDIQSFSDAYTVSIGPLIIRLGVTFDVTRTSPGVFAISREATL